jgi:hypothetical protein
LNINLILDDRDQVNQALARLRELDGADLYPMFKSITIRNCYDKQSIPPGLWEEMYRSAASTQFRGTGAIGELDNIIYLGLKNSCTQLEKDNLSILVDNLLANPEFLPVRAQLYDLATNLALIRQKPAEALQYINNALALSGSVDRSIVKLKILLALEQVDTANQLLQQIRHGLRARPGDSLFYQDQLQVIEQSLLQLTQPVR